MNYCDDDYGNDSSSDDEGIAFAENILLNSSEKIEEASNSLKEPNQKLEETPPPSAAAQIPRVRVPCTFLSFNYFFLVISDSSSLQT